MKTLSKYGNPIGRPKGTYGRERTAMLCDCGNRATRKVNSAWQCERCIEIDPKDYHGMTAGIRPTTILNISANRILVEFKEANRE